MRRVFLGLAVAVLAAGAAAADEKAEAVVKQAIAAHGGADALNKYKAGKCKMKGEITIAGTDVEFSGSLSYGMPDKYRLDMSAEIMGQKLTIKQVVNGEKVKSAIKVGDTDIPANGDAEKDELKLAAALQEAEMLTPLLDAKKFTVKLGEEAEVNGKKASVLIVTPKAVKKDVKLYVDKTSGLVVKTSHKGIGPGDAGAPVEVLEETYHSDFKKVNGVQVPMKLEVKHDDKKFMTVTLSDYDLTEKFDEKEFSVD